MGSMNTHILNALSISLNSFFVVFLHVYVLVIWHYRTWGDITMSLDIRLTADGIWWQMITVSWIVNTHSLLILITRLWLVKACHLLTWPICWPLIGKTKHEVDRNKHSNSCSINLRTQDTFSTLLKVLGVVSDPYFHLDLTFMDLGLI